MTTHGAIFLPNVLLITHYCYSVTFYYRINVTVLEIYCLASPS